MFGRAYRVASVRGVGIEMSPSWLVIVGLLAWTLADDIFPARYDGWATAAYWAVGIGAALSLPVSVVLHELSHASAAIRRGITVPKVTLFVFGGQTHHSRHPKSPGEEFAIASAGVITSVDIAYVASVPGDCPFLPRDLVIRLHQAREASGQPLACARSGEWRHPVVGVWPVALA